MLEIPEPMPGRKPIHRPEANAKIMVLMFSMMSLKPMPRPFMFLTSTSGIFASPLALSRMIWHMANIPSICATVLMPEVRYTLPKVKRVAPLMGSMPTQPMSRPMPADMMPLKMLPLDREAIRVMAQKHREKYSQGPRCRAASAITGDSTVAIATEHTVPMKEAVMPMPSALLACPFWVMG